MKALKPLLLFLPFVVKAQQYKDTIPSFNEYMEKVSSKDAAAFKRKGNYNHGIYDGKIKNFDLSNGQIMRRGEYYSWAKDSVFKYYLRTGMKYAIVNYSEDHATMVNGWDTLGNKTVTKGRGYFRWNNPFNGNYSNGNVRCKEQYEKGIKSGKCEMFFESGEPNCGYVYIQPKQK